MSVPTVEEAKRMLADAETRNPGPWVNHSVYVGKAAQAIARGYGDLDADVALVMGVLHDIGRGSGVSEMRHGLDGYRAMRQAGHDEVAVVCLTHSFPLPDVRCYAGTMDCSDEEIAFVQGYLTNTPYTGYDRLIQLCDALCLSTGFCLLEKRLVDVAMRQGTNSLTVAKWRKWFEIKADMEARIGRSIYDLLPGVVANTFA